MTVINNTAPPQRESSGSGFLLGVVLLILFFVLFFYYGLPMLRSYTPQAPQINVPGKIDVNVNQK
jgi:hypothetical protein